MHDEEASKIISVSREVIQEIKGDYTTISHGDNDAGDYIIHIIQTHLERPFPQDLTPIYSIIKKHLDPHLKMGDKVIVFPPPPEWEFKLITLKCKNIASKWNFYPESLKTPCEALVKELDEYLNEITPKKVLR
jgi:hypothetical protein